MNDKIGVNDIERTDNYLRIPVIHPKVKQDIRDYRYGEAVRIQARGEMKLDGRSVVGNVGRNRAEG